MKKKFLIPAVGLICLASFSFQSCIGSFALTNKVLDWNHNVSNKFVNELVFFAFWVLPVYEVTAVADLLVINSIEFWSGNNPLEANNKVIRTDDGNYYIHADATGYKITSPDGHVMCFAYDKERDSWSFGKGEGEKIEFMKFVDEDHVLILNGEGKFVDVELSRDGIDEFKGAITAPLMASVR